MIEVEKLLFNPSIEPPKKEYCFYLKDVPVASLGNMITITGKAKSGKTTFCNTIVGSATNKKEVLSCRIINPPPITDKKESYPREIICIDTEQTERDMYEQFTRLQNTIGEKINQENLYVYRLRGIPTNKRITYIEEILYNHPMAYLVIIDNILDLALDFNNPTEARHIIDTLLKLTDVFNILLINLIHLSKTTGFILGHLGSGLQRSSNSVFRVEKNTNLDCINVISDVSRNFWQTIEYNIKYNKDLNNFYVF